MEPNFKASVNKETAESLISISSGVKIELSPEEVLAACQQYIRDHFGAVKIGFLLTPVKGQALPSALVFEVMPTI